ncbi:unnamed protein product, partial [Staurois parvus]
MLIALCESYTVASTNYGIDNGIYTSRGGLTIWKLGHCLRARDAPGTFFIGFFEFGQGHRSPMIPYCPG